MIPQIAWLTLASLLLAGCSSTTISGSWKNPDFTGKISKVYVVGISKQETMRRLYEDEFRNELQAYGVTGISSYRDLPNAAGTSKATISAKVQENGADSVLLATATGKRTEEVVNPGRITSYDTNPYGRRDYHRYSPQPYYRDYGSYYSRSREITYEPATVSRFEVITIEANLYDAATAELIWSAQLETIVEQNSEKLIKDFIKTVTKELNDQGLI